MPVPASRPASRASSRSRLIDAASHEFAEHGYSGANVDRIARAARINKAMIYYYFKSKVGLYREVLGVTYRGIAARVSQPAMVELPPEQALRDFIGALADEAVARPYLPRIMMRELADNARNLDAATIALAVAIPNSLGAIVARGVRAGVFRPVSPAFVYLTIIGPLMLFLGSAPLRARVAAGPLQHLGSSPDAIRAHVTATVLASLRPQDAAAPAGPRRAISKPASRPRRTPLSNGSPS